MAYLALYRAFRPTTLDDVVRQEHIVTVLKNQIATGKIGHAYLFCGPRGTGKTSIAKIFDRDHSTIISSHRLIENKILEDSSILADINDIKKEI